jgi:hypothetical protein
MHQLRNVPAEVSGGESKYTPVRVTFSVQQIATGLVYAVSILALAISMGACASLTANKPQAEGLPTMGNASLPTTWQEYRQDEIGFSIHHPETWKVGIEMMEPGFGAIFEIVDSQVDADIQSSLMFEVFPTSDAMIPDEMDVSSSESVLSYISQQVEASGEYELGDAHTRDVSGYPSALRSFKSLIEGSPAEGFLLVLSTPENVWIITGVATDPEVNTANASIYGDMLKSIVIEE